MKRRAARPLPILLAFLVIAAWLVISNHCALAIVFRGNNSASEHAHCHQSQSAPAKEHQDEQLPCCKVLRATIAAPAKVPASALSGLAPLTAWISKVVSFDDRQIQPVSYRIDTGPPFATSFAELILQRSLLSHAPPVLV